MGGEGQKELTQDAILAAEFGYIAQSLFQANEDRSRVTSFYLVTFGSFIAALFSASQIPNPDVPRIYTAFAALFVVLAIMSHLTLLQILRLREAWFDSAAAMNQIKDYYIRNVKATDLDAAFRWKPGGLGEVFKWRSVGFYLALQVAILGGACLGAAVMFGGLAASNQQWWLWWLALPLALAYTAWQVHLYRRILTNSKVGAERYGDRPQPGADAAPGAGQAIEQVQAGA